MVVAFVSVMDVLIVIAAIVLAVSWRVLGRRFWVGKEAWNFSNRGVRVVEDGVLVGVNIVCKGRHKLRKAHGLDEQGGREK